VKNKKCSREEVEKKKSENGMKEDKKTKTRNIDFGK